MGLGVGRSARHAELDGRRGDRPDDAEGEQGAHGSEVVGAELPGEEHGQDVAHRVGDDRGDSEASRRAEAGRRRLRHAAHRSSTRPGSGSRSADDASVPDGPSAAAAVHADASPREAVFWLVVAAGVVGVVVLTDVGRTAIDTKPQLYLNPDAVLASSLSAWQTIPALGQRSYESGLLLPSVVATALQAVGLPPWLIMRVLRVVLVLVGMTGAAWLARRRASPTEDPGRRAQPPSSTSSTPMSSSREPPCRSCGPGRSCPGRWGASSWPSDHGRSWLAWTVAAGVCTFGMAGQNAGSVGPAPDGRLGPGRRSGGRPGPPGKGGADRSRCSGCWPARSWRCRRTGCCPRFWPGEPAPPWSPRPRAARRSPRCRPGARWSADWGCGRSTARTGRRRGWSPTSRSSPSRSSSSPASRCSRRPGGRRPPQIGCDCASRSV